MPTINKRFLLQLVLALLVATAALALAHTVQASRIPDALRRQVELSAEKGKHDTAIHYMRQYLEFRPDDADAVVRLAELIRERNPNPRAHTELLFLYDRVLRLDPARNDVRRDALALALRIGRHSDAAAHAAALLAEYPTDGKLWLQMAAAQAALNAPEARKSFEAAVTHAPALMEGYQRFAQYVWKQQNDAAGAKAVLDRMVAAMPQEADAYLIRARFENFTADEPGRGGPPVGSVERALADLRRTFELDPENPDASHLLAEILQKGRDVGAAHAILKDAVALYPKELRLVRSLAWMELVRGNLPASIAVLEDGLKATPTGFDLLVPLADLMVQQGDTARTADILKRLEERKAPPVQVKYLKSRVAMRENRWADAVELLESIRADSVGLPGLEAQANLLLAACYGRTGDAAAEERSFKRVVDADPGHVTARVGLGTLYMNRGRFDEASREFEAAAQSPFAQGSVLAQAIRLRVRRLKAGGGSEADWKRLEQAAAGAVARFGPASSEPVMLLAEIAVAQGNRDDAISFLRKEAIRRPGDARLWATLADTTADAAGTAAGLAVLDEAQAAAGDGPDVRLARAALYARDPAAVRPIDPLGEATEAWPESDQARLLYGLADMHDRAGDRAGVVRALKRVAVRRPGDAAVWSRLVEHASAAGDATAAAEARTALAKIEGEDGAAVVIADALRADAADPAAAAKLLATFTANPTRADACLALARAKAAAGDSADALRLLERACGLEPTRFEPVRALLLHLARTRADDLAARLIGKLAADPRWAGEPFRRLAFGVAAEAGPEPGRKVVELCRPYVEREPGGLGWVARCYSAIGAKSDADAALAAATISPVATADDWLRLALNDKAKADETLAAARGKLPKAAFFALAAAYAETAAGKDAKFTFETPAEKRGYAQARLAVKLSRAAPAEAVGVLEAFLKDDGVPPADAGWAKRNLAMILVLAGGAAERARAMDLVREGSLDAAATIEDHRATSAVFATLARYLEGDDRQAVLTRGIQALEAAHKVSASPRDLFHLSQLYRAANRPADSRTCLQQLINKDQRNLYYLVSAVELLSAAETNTPDFASGETFARHLLAVHPGEFRAIAAAARYEVKAGRPDRALTLAEGYTRNADPAAGDFLTRSARVAELLDELARQPKVRGTPTAVRMADAAAERYAALLATRPEALVAVAGSLASSGRTAEAFAKVESLGRTLPLRVRALAGLAALRAGGATDRQFATVREWLDGCLKDDPNSTPLKLNEAEFLALKGDYAAAGAAYETVLGRDPRNVIALNNLAWLWSADPRSAGKSLDLIDRAAREVGLSGELLDTRARARITLKQLELAQKDLGESLRQERTPLRLFHQAMARLAESPPREAEAKKAFREARDRGLDPKGIHRDDLPVYKVLDADANPPQ